MLSEILVVGQSPPGDGWEDGSQVGTSFKMILIDFKLLFFGKF